MKKTGNEPCLLDTNIVIYLFKGEQTIAKEISNSKAVYLPVFALGELYLGAENSGRKAHHYAQIQTFLKIATILNANPRTALIYGQLKAYLRKKGTPIPENDIWIAALAQQHALPLVTRDVHFRGLPDVQTVVW